jgi:4-amino-4-deoxy-L-arabinose transferase-like glycosyltransferase
MRTVTLVLALALLALRLPSLVQPMGADQSLYAYVGERIRSGGLPYRDAWDQKPPAIHFLYAGLRTIWPGDAAVPAADLAAAAIVAFLLYRLGNALGPAGAGAAASLLFLLLSNPAFTRVGGVRLRSQCETFIAVAVAAAFALVLQKPKRPLGVVLAGVLCGMAFALKYNAAVFAVAVVAALWLRRSLTTTDLVRMMAGFAVPAVAIPLVFAFGGALRPLIDATIVYNLQYSGETYRTPLDIARYVVTFPIERARFDALWTVGGAGCLILLSGALGGRERLLPVVWVGAACVSIAINGSRGLPQYFIQANPALALAAGWGGALAWSWLRAGTGRAARLIAVPLVLAVAVAAWRVNQFDKLAEQTLFDARYALGRMTRETYLARYDDDRKYSALAADTLGKYLAAHSQPDDRIYVFGFTCAAYVEAGRVSASRFFWSRPVIAGFNEGRVGYGSGGLLSDLSVNRPAVVALQRRDWAPDVEDSAAWFMKTPSLAGWLRAHYVRAEGLDGFDIWLRRSGTP